MSAEASAANIEPVAAPDMRRIIATALNGLPGHHSASSQIPSYHQEHLQNPWGDSCVRVSGDLRCAR